jgi:hypothetical protein
MEHYLCPVCRAPMNRDLSGHMPKMRHVQITLLTILASALCYLTLGVQAAAKSLLVYLPFWAIFEFLHWVQMRESLQCRVCDFDPMLYQKDWRKARLKVEGKMTKVHKEIEAEIQARIERLRPLAQKVAASTETAKTQSVPTEAAKTSRENAEAAASKTESQAKTLNSL